MANPVTRLVSSAKNFEKHRFLSQVGYYSGALSAIYRLRESILVVLGYHRLFGGKWGGVSEVQGPHEAITQDKFAQHVDWLKGNTHILSMQELLDVIDGAKPPKRQCSMITFDDGYLDNYELAFPILKAAQAPATFFIPAGLVEERKLGWWDEICYLLKKCTKERINFYGQTYNLETQRSEAMTDLNNALQYDKELVTHEFLDTLAEETGVPRPQSDVAERELMNWEQLRTMANNGMEVAGHSLTHEVLARIPEDQQRHELSASRALLEERLNRPTLSMAYPVGGYRHFSERTAELTREAGYKVSFSFCTGSANRWGALDPFDIKRAAARGSVSQTFSQLAVPELFDDYINRTRS